MPTSASPPSTKKSIGISFATQYSEMLIQFLGVLALARILAPQDIGTYSIAAFLMTLLHVFRDFGVVQYVIQERELTAAKIQSAMGVSIILAGSMALLLLALSGSLARFYDNPEIESILHVAAASFAFAPFGSTLMGIMRREFRLMSILYIKTASALCHVATAVTLALHGYGALSLAWANFVGIVSFGLMANLLRPAGVPFTPRFRNVREVLSFGGVASLGTAANIAGTNSPDVVIGKVMDMAAVGYFSRANGLVGLFTRLITGALTPLALPYFSSMRRENKPLDLPYLLAVSQLTAVAWPFFAALAILALPMIRALYGDQWDASVRAAQLLCAGGAISSVSLFATQVMIANGQLRQSTYANLMAQPMRVMAVLASSVYGLEAIAAALVGAELLALVIISYYLHQSLGVGPLRLARACATSAVLALCSAIGPWLVMHNAAPDWNHPWPPLLAGICGAALGWFGSMAATRHPLGIQLWQIARPLLARAGILAKPKEPL